MSIKSDAAQAKNDYDRKLEVQILPPVSALKVKLTEVPKEVLAGEVFPVTIELANTGPNEITEIFLATCSPREVILKPESLHEMPLSIEKGEFFCIFQSE